MTAPTLLPIGTLEAATGLAVSALRHYDELGLITPVERVGGKRCFTEDTVGRVNFVRRAQRCGFTLAEIRDVIDDDAQHARPIVNQKIAALRAQQVELATMIAMLEEVQECGCQVVAECPGIAKPC